MYSVYGCLEYFIIHEHKIQDRKGFNSMNKSELVAAVAEKTALTKKDATAAVEAVFASISDAMQKKEKVQLIGFGTFQTSERKARTGKNPRTGEAVKIAACTVPAFKAGKGLKEKVNTKPAKKAAKKK